MADQSIALQVHVPNIDAASPLLKAQSYFAGQQALEQGDQAIQTGKMILNAKGIDYQNELIRNAAAHSLDADSWDDAMRAAASKGATAAQQYVGRYTPLLQQRLFEAYGGGQGPGAAAAGTGSAIATGAGGSSDGTGGGAATAPTMDQRFKNASPEQMQQSLQRLDMISGALQGVRDQKSWDQAVAQLQAQGIPQAAQFAGAYSPLRVQQLWNQIQPVRTYLQGRVADSAAGIPNPLIPRNLIKTDAGVVEADPYAAPGTPGKMIVATPTYDRTNAVDAKGRPIVFDKHTGAMSTGPTSGPAPDAAAPEPGAIPLTELATRIHGIENGGGDRGAQNPNSTATGNGQFIESTWLKTLRAARPELADMSDSDLLKLRKDPAFSQEMTAQLAQNNGATLQKAGLPVTTATLAAAHRFGTDDAEAIMNAPVNTPMADVLSAKVMKANPDLAKMTTGDYLHGLAAKVGNDPVNLGLPTAPQGVQTLSPFEKSVQEKIEPKQYEEAQDQYDSAQKMKVQLRSMQDQLDTLGSSGFLSPGTGATARLNWAKRMNSYAAAAGLKPPFDANKVAAGEDIGKTSTRLGFDLARQLGSREAMQIVQQAQSAVPGIENTPKGAKLIFGALGAAADRQSDYYQFLNDWVKTRPSTMGADVAFNKAYPVEHYTNQALLAAIPPKLANGVDPVANLKAHPDTARDFDSYFGKGLAAVILGKK